MPEADRRTSVFVNCPFDPAFRPLLDRIVFTIRFCGFSVRSALEVQDSGEPRLAKIMRLIETSRLSIHDVSRVELDWDSGLPRFNMPIELGIALGAKHLGRSALRDHQLLVLDSERFRYQTFASDLAGVDIAAHGSDPETIIGEVRSFLASQSAGHLPGRGAIVETFGMFEGALPDIAAAERQQVGELTFSDRLRHLGTWLETLT